MEFPSWRMGLFLSMGHVIMTDYWASKRTLLYMPASKPCVCFRCRNPSPLSRQKGKKAYGASVRACLIPWKCIRAFSHWIIKNTDEQTKMATHKIIKYKSYAVPFKFYLFRFQFDRTQIRRFQDLRKKTTVIRGIVKEFLCIKMAHFW